MLRTLRPIGQLLAQRASGVTTVSAAPADNHVTMAALQFMADVVESNTEHRHRMDDKFNASLDKFSSSLDSLKESFSSSQNSLRTDFSSLRADFSSLKDSQNSSQNSLKAEIHSLDKKVTSIIAISSFVASLVTLAGVTIRAGLLDASSAQVVAKTVEAASTPWYHFW
jgi:hypothetical protein